MAGNSIAATAKKLASSSPASASADDASPTPRKQRSTSIGEAGKQVSTKATLKVALERQRSNSLARWGARARPTAARAALPHAAPPPHLRLPVPGEVPSPLLRAPTTALSRRGGSGGAIEPGAVVTRPRRRSSEPAARPPPWAGARDAASAPQDISPSRDRSGLDAAPSPPADPLAALVLAFGSVAMEARAREGGGEAEGGTLNHLAEAEAGLGGACAERSSLHELREGLGAPAVWKKEPQKGRAPAPAGCGLPRPQQRALGALPERQEAGRLSSCCSSPGSTSSTLVTEEVRPPRALPNPLALSCSTN